MPGRSRIAYRKTTKSILHGHDNEVENQDDTRCKLLSRIASQHTQLGNKLKNIAKRMITNTRKKADQESFRENQRLNESTRQTYLKLAEEVAAKRSLSDQQKEQIKGNRKKKQFSRSKTQQTEKQTMRSMTSTWMNCKMRHKKSKT